MTKGKENELFFNISISGFRYTLYKEDVRRYPTTLLAELADWEPWTTDGMPKRLPYGFHHNPSSNEFYLLRSPKLFEMILYYYATGQFHVPSEICFDLIEEELSFWKLDKVIFAACCKDRDPRPEILSVSEADTTSSNEFYGDNWRKRTWTMFEDPNSSWKAKLIMMVTVFFTTISIANMIAGSLPSLQFCSEEFEQAHNNLSVRFYLESMELYSHCRGTLVFGTVDALCTIWFTIEFITRFFVSPNKFKFMNNAMNIIDLFSALPFFFELIVWAVLQEDMHTYNSHTVIVILRLLRFLRITRLLKMCKYSDDLQILYGTFNMARRELMMLTIFTSFGLLIFATLLYYIEKDEKDTNFSSIPASCWWAIVTLTTAGYGDVTPHTAIGKVVAGVACVSGILIMALPISVLVENFSNVYTRKVKPNNKPYNVQYKNLLNNFLEEVSEEKCHFISVGKHHHHQSVDSFLSNK